ncbi:MAG: TlyA family RNA methyltransferase [Filifactoraceae bacterium]
MKERIDVLLVERGLFDSRERAKKNIMAGKVMVNNMLCDKAGTLVDVESKIFIKEDTIPYVSRGGLKLEKAMKEFRISLSNKVCMDIGSSTGGFTDCMLKNNALHVYSVDVGYGQLDWNLRNNEKVSVLERTNIRYLEREKLPLAVDFYSIDVSFISLKLVLPKLIELGATRWECVALIKPQFEVGRSEVGKNGVVKEPEKHKSAIEKAIGYAKSNNMKIINLSYSPIKGPKGNIEYLMYITNRCDIEENYNIDMVVEKSHKELRKSE